MMRSECVAAISTPPGEGGIAIVRLSGTGSVEIADACFRSRSGASLQERRSHTLTLGWCVDTQGNLLDEVLVGLMRAPHSYTGEDVVEFNCHGGMVVARSVLERFLEKGARLAEPGEFTKRAFLNGRLDMTQAEAVIDVIKSRSEKALSLSVRNLEGVLNKQVNRIKEALVMVNSRIEAALDFPEEVGDPDHLEIEKILTAAEKELARLVDSGRRGLIFREGLRVVIAGKPNVGKSTLLNRLLKKEKAIVTEFAGTTRDIIEDMAVIGGIPVYFADTAGIRETNEPVEVIGVERSRRAAEAADLVLFALDAGTGLTREDYDVLNLIKGRKTIMVLNKDDLHSKKMSGEEARKLLPEAPFFRVSALSGKGMEEMEHSIEKVALEGAEQTGEELMVNLRQQGLLDATLAHIRDAVAAWGRREPLDCIAVDTWGAIDCLQELTGENIKADVLEKIFADFCIGK